MIIRLAGLLMNDLLQKPETGMGYQVVEVTTLRNEIRRAIVYNAELLVFEKEPHVRRVAATYADLIGMAQSSKDTIKRVRAQSRFEVQPVFAGGAVSSGARFKSLDSSGADDASADKTGNAEVFKRFTAYRNDHRITPSGGLVAGTYATTEQDAKNVKSGQEAVERYALPNPQPAVHVFTIRPPTKTKVKRGFVQPAFGRRGGGVEVLFTAGSPSHTVTGPDIIPPW